VSRVRPLPHAAWGDPVAPAVTAAAAPALEAGEVLLLSALPFQVTTDERQIFSPAILSSSKNASFDPHDQRVGGTTLEGAARDQLRDVMARFSAAADALVAALLPAYRGHLVRARASFRPAEIAGRATSWRKDDTRLHVDSFPASPVQGRRILRVFSNVNPEGRSRTWRVGPDFETVAARYAGELSLPLPGSALLLRALKVTKSRRTAYDALMLQLHDRMKDDQNFQQTPDQESFDFPAGATWIAFTDQVSHAATAGQYQFEQTFLLPVSALQDEASAPIRVLERLKSRRLA
jgi:hypothetical protein